MVDERPLREEVLDLVFYAPVGLAVQASEALPGLISTGRERIGTTLGTARAIGEFTVGTLRRRAAAAVRGRLATDQQEPVAVVPAEAPNRARGGTAPSAGRHLAIEGYDTLAASQIVTRLAGCTRAERAEIRAYEEANRGRRTILARLAQLDEASDGRA